MGGNKHKNGIVCTFPGCEKTMRTQKFKIHFSKQHLKPGELYTVEHRRRFEVARDDDGSCSPGPVSAPAAAAAAAVKIQALPVAAPSLPTAFHASLAPQLAPLAADSAAASSSEETVGSSSSSSKEAEEPEEMLSPQMTAAIARSSALLQQQQQRFSGAAVSPVVGVKRAAPERSLAPEIANTDTTNERAGASPSLFAAASAATSTAEQQDPSSVVLAQLIGMLDGRFRELIQKMGQVIDGQHEIADLLRLVMEPPPSLSPADASGRKRRRGGGAAAEHENGGGASSLL